MLPEGLQAGIVLRPEILSFFHEADAHISEQPLPVASLTRDHHPEVVYVMSIFKRQKASMLFLGHDYEFLR
jgi:hypothetical protein